MSLTTTLALMFASAEAIKMLLERSLEWLSALIGWIIKSELETTASLVRFMFGGEAIQSLGEGRILISLFENIYLSLRLIFLGTLLGAFSGAKLILGIAWAVTFIIYVSLKMTTNN